MINYASKNSFGNKLSGDGGSHEVGIQLRLLVLWQLIFLIPAIEAAILYYSVTLLKQLLVMTFNFHIKCTAV